MKNELVTQAETDIINKWIVYDESLQGRFTGNKKLEEKNLASNIDGLPVITVGKELLDRFSTEVVSRRTSSNGNDYSLVFVVRRPQSLMRASLLQDNGLDQIVGVNPEIKDAVGIYARIGQEDQVLEKHKDRLLQDYVRIPASIAQIRELNVGPDFATEISGRINLSWLGLNVQKPKVIVHSKYIDPYSFGQETIPETIVNVRGISSEDEIDFLKMQGWDTSPRYMDLRGMTEEQRITLMKEQEEKTRFDHIVRPDLHKALGDLIHGVYKPPTYLFDMPIFNDGNNFEFRIGQVFTNQEISDMLQRLGVWKDRYLVDLFLPTVDLRSSVNLPLERGRGRMDLKTMMDVFELRLNDGSRSPLLIVGGM